MTTIYLNHNLGLLVTDSRATETEIEFCFWNRVLPFFFKPKVHFIGNKVIAQKSLWVHDNLFTASGSVEQIDQYLNHLIFGTTPCYKTSKQFNFNALLIGRSWVLCIDCESGKVTKQFYCVGQNGRFNLSMGSGGNLVSHLVQGNENVRAKDLSEEYVLREFKEHVVNDPYSDDNINIYRFKEKTNGYK